MTFDEETRDSPAAREAQAGLPARRAAVELLSAVSTRSSRSTTS